MARWRNFFQLALVNVILLSVVADEKLRLCVKEDVTDSSCNALERGDSPMKCERVIDSAECAIKLAEKRADFGIFTADELLLMHQFYPVGLDVIAELKRQDVNRAYDDFEFQSVVVVPKSYRPTENGFGGLVGSGFCHPGFGKTQLWNDHELKYFEQKVMNNVCRRDATVAENEIINLKDFFKKACRPGEWVADGAYDAELKKKYPELCELCDDRKNCKYSNSDKHGHVGALDCLTSGRGQVAYASFHYVREYFGSTSKMSDYQYLCENGTVMPLDSSSPCAWFKQPWNAILSREDKSNEVVKKLVEAQSIIGRSTDSWAYDLNTMLFKEVKPKIYDNFVTPSHYLSRGREVTLPQSLCGQEIRWCTTGDLELTKCKWLAAAALALGIKPAIKCVEASSNFDCFEKISKNDADIITIDSNYGHLARQVYGLTSLMYCEPTRERDSFVVGVIRENAKFRRISSLQDLKDSNACFPEYGGIAWLSFINAARDHRVLSDSCKYPQIVANLLAGACTPGFVQDNHSLKGLKPKLNTGNLVSEITQEKLCSLCPIQDNGERCEATDQNRFYGDKGALNCLSEGGDIAFLEARNMKALIANGSVNASEYRVLCKNGTLASYTGFDVDDTCAFSVTIDSEVVSRRNRPNQQLRDTTLALLKIENWLGYRAGSQRPVRIYDRFNGTADLLFKDSTNGLVSTDSTVSSVVAYKELFRHVDTCSGAAVLVSGLALVIVNLALAKIL